MGALKMEPVAWSSDMRKSIALCNDLVPLGGRNVSGHADERKAFTDVEAAFLVRPICLLHAAEAAFLVRLICLFACNRNCPSGAASLPSACIRNLTMHYVICNVASYHIFTTQWCVI